MTQQLKLGFMQDKDQQNMSIADVYSVIGIQLMPEFIMKIAILRKTNDTIYLPRRY
jgi:hypothetical protein